MPSYAQCQQCFAFLLFILCSFHVQKSQAEEGVKLGDACQNSQQCLVLTANSTCSDGICSCQSGFFRISEVNSSFCENSVKLGDACQNSQQCLVLTANSTCSDGICSCQSGFFPISEVNSSFCENNDADATDDETSPPKGRQQQVDPKMIIIMVVLAVMFVGICVALHMFSKARFRNHRTIFNSPHPRLMHIKLGKKKGRRRASHTSLEAPGSRQLSICSQLSPLQSRRGSQATSPEFSQKPRKSSGDKRDTSHAHRVPKMDSADKGASRVRTDSPANMTNGPGSPTVIVASNKPNVPNSSASARV